jgi:hypothetical protein
LQLPTTDAPDLQSLSALEPNWQLPPALSPDLQRASVYADPSEHAPCATPDKDIAIGFSYMGFFILAVFFIFLSRQF